MFQRLFRSREPAPDAGPPQAPPDTVVYAVGDIHGRLDLLERLHDQIRADAQARAAARRVVVYLGDYVDRGHDSRGVIDLLLEEPLDGFERVLLKGNHEDMLLHFLADPGEGPLWLVNGGRETLMSYGVRQAPGVGGNVLSAMRDEFATALPPEHRDFLLRLGLTHREGDYLFVHAGIRPGVALEAQEERDLIWIREDFLLSDREHGQIVVHGHTPTQAPEERGNRIGIDTGAYATGRLTCLALEGTERRYLTT